MEIRELVEQEIGKALDLVLETFMEFEAPDYGSTGVNTFINCLNDKDFVGRLKFYGAFKNELLIGVTATRDEGNHIAMFFVNKAHHKKGIGRALFEYILPKSTGDIMTVNSSPYAVDIYRKLGFIATSEEQVTDGIRFTPMEYKKQLI